MPILFGAIAYKSDLPQYDDFLNEWLDKSLKPAPSVVKCPKCDVEYKLIEPDVETEGTVNSDIAALKKHLADAHPDHPPCVPFRASGDPNLEDQARRICNPAKAEPKKEPKRESQRESQPIQQPTEEIKYPTWQPECRAVMIEIDPAKVKEKLAAAEAAMAKRSAQLTGSGDDPERRAMKEEGDAMRLALAEVLSQHPDLKK